MSSGFILQLDFHIVTLLIDVWLCFELHVFSPLVGIIIFFEPGVFGFHQIKVAEFLNQQADIVDDFFPKLPPDLKTVLELILPGFVKLQSGDDLFFNLEVLLFDSPFLLFYFRGVLCDFLFELFNFDLHAFVLILEFVHDFLFVVELLFQLILFGHCSEFILSFLVDFWMGSFY